MKRLRFALVSAVALLLLTSFALDIEAGRRSRDRNRDRVRDDRTSTREPRTREPRTRQRAVRYDQLRSGDVVELPTPDGETTRYQLTSAPLLSEALARDTASPRSPARPVRPVRCR